MDGRRIRAALNLDDLTGPSSSVHCSKIVLFMQQIAINDTKNILLAWVSAGTTLLSTIGDGLMPLVSAVVLPIVFFAIGKTVDVLVQLYVNRKRKEDK
jgi:hypothetical protein